MSDVVAGVRSYAKSLWWLALLRGVLAIVIGVLALTVPAEFALFLIILIAVYLLFDGFTFIFYGAQARNEDPSWGWSIALGVLSVLAGLVILIWPASFGITAGLVVLWIIAISSLVGGTVESIGVLRENPRRPEWGWLLSGSIITAVFGILLIIVLFANPAAALSALIWVFGVYAIVLGVFLVIAAIALRAGVKRFVGDIRDAANEIVGTAAEAAGDSATKK